MRQARNSNENSKPIMMIALMKMLIMSILLVEGLPLEFIRNTKDTKDFHSIQGCQLSSD